jgi:hypothetical protein
MPIDKSWGEEEKIEYVAQITDLREATDLWDSDEGTQELRRIYVDIDNLDANNPKFPLRFNASKSSSGNWMKWLRAIEELGFKCKDDPNKLIGNYVHVRLEPTQYKIRGQEFDKFFPRPMALLTSEAAAKAVFDTLPKVAPKAVAMPTVLDEELVNLYNSLKSLPNGQTMFTQLAKDKLPEGMTADEAWALAEGGAMAF